VLRCWFRDRFGFFAYVGALWCAEKKCLNSELWHACAGPLVCLPTVGTRVVYFPQGHSEQVSQTPRAASLGLAAAAGLGLPAQPYHHHSTTCIVHTHTHTHTLGSCLALRTRCCLPCLTLTSPGAAALIALACISAQANACVWTRVKVAASTNKEVDGHIPNYPNLPPQLICQLHDVTMHVRDFLPQKFLTDAAIRRPLRFSTSIGR
jgi:hypothetical protein